MNILKHKINFAIMILVNGANPNGDPLAGNMPRTDIDGYGEMSDVCIKRKIRNRMQDLGHEIFVKSDDRIDDKFKTLEARAKESGFDKITDSVTYHNNACKMWTDVRTFGQVFPFKAFKVASVGVRGPVTMSPAVSVAPVDIESLQITKSTTGSLKDEGKERGSDTMGMKHRVKHGLYVAKGSISVQLAEKTGFTEEDAELLKECLRTLFVNDESAARPDGSMEVAKVFWWEHDCKDGQYTSAKVHNSLDVRVRDGVSVPKSISDYVIDLKPLDGLECEVIEGL